MKKTAILPIQLVEFGEKTYLYEFQLDPQETGEKYGHPLNQRLFYTKSKSVYLY